MRLLAALLALGLAACAPDTALEDSPTDPAARRAETRQPAADPVPAPGGSGAAFASVYTDLDLGACEVLAEYEEGGGVELRCPGYDGVPLFVSEGDLRVDVDAGVPNDRFDTPAGFNSLGPRAEWRLHDGEPFAVIVRYEITGPSGGMENDGTSDLAVLTVGRKGAPGCLVGYVPAAASPSQNEAARALADTRAFEGVCADG